VTAECVYARMCGNVNGKREGCSLDTLECYIELKERERERENALICGCMEERERLLE